MSSLPWAVWDCTKSTLRDMASAGQFTAVGNDKLAPLNRNSVVGRYSGSRSHETRERGIPLPGLVITYLGWRNNIAMGTFCQDDGLIRLLIQLVDSGSGWRDDGFESYVLWMNRIREELQANPYEFADDTLGHVYLVHVSEQSAADDERWAILDEMRMHCIVSCYTRTRYDKTREPWSSA